MEGMEMVKRLILLFAVLLWPSLSRSLEGVPSAFWFASGAPAGENAYIFSADTEGGFGGPFVGGVAGRSMKAGKYVAVPLTLRYGFIQGWEIYGVLPYFWGSSDQEYVNSAVLGAPETYRETLSGGDFGDIATVVKWAVWENDTRDSFFCVHLGGRFATGTDPWQYSQNNFVTGPVPPRLAHGDAAGGGVMAGIQYVNTESFPRMDMTLGYIFNLPFEATAMDTVRSAINVDPPSTLTGKAAVSGVIAGSWWLGLDVDGYWAPAGKISGTGDFKKDPGALSKMIDSYANLVRESAGLWAGASTGVDIAPEASVSLGFKAPVAVSGGYRFWRTDFRLVYSAPLFK
jgi:hypothetical protein